MDWPLVGIIGTGYLYALGGRLSAARPNGGKRARAAAFYAGLGTLAVALEPPVDTYAERLFWVHMVQHVLLTMVAPPLLLLGRPWPRLARALPLGIRRPIARSFAAGGALHRVRWMARPVPAFILFNGTLLAWHVPWLFDLTLTNPNVHHLEHAMFFGTALLFWRNLLPSSRPQLSDAARVAYGTGALVVSWALALVLALAPDPIYSAYADLVDRPGGISALADQQLAAGVMWVPASIPYTVVLLVAVLRWLDPGALTGRRHRLALRPRETS